MFTGIVEATGKIVDIKNENNRMTLFVKADFFNELKIDQSVAHNGVCLTVDGLFDNIYSVTLIQETLQKTNFETVQVGDIVNLERCLKLGDRLDGHMVQGHVDSTATLIEIAGDENNPEFVFTYKNLDHVTVSKGSICVNGVSLTVVQSEKGKFSVALIPYTIEHTNFHKLKVGDLVNIEFDILGKYIQAYMQR